MLDNGEVNLTAARGSLLVLQPIDEPAPDMLVAQNVLDRLLRRSADEAPPVASSPDLAHVLVIGTWFNQMLTHMPWPVADDEVAAHAGLADEGFHVHWLDDPFTDFSIGGDLLGRFVACRPSAFQCRSPKACGLFLDCRDLGRLVCYRSCPSHILEVADLLRFVDVDVPDGFVANIDGGIYDARLDSYGSKTELGLRFGWRGLHMKVLVGRSLLVNA